MIVSSNIQRLPTPVSVTHRLFEYVKDIKVSQTWVLKYINYHNKNIDSIVAQCFYHTIYSARVDPVL